MMIFLALKLSDAAFILLINVKMPTIVGILTFKHEKVLYLETRFIQVYSARQTQRLASLEK